VIRVTGRKKGGPSKPITPSRCTGGRERREISDLRKEVKGKVRVLFSTLYLLKRKRKGGAQGGGKRFDHIQDLADEEKIVPPPATPLGTADMKTDRYGH